MLLRHLLLIVMTLFITACHHRESAQDMMLMSMPPVQQRNLPHFTQVHVEGAINVRLRTGFSRSQVILHGDPRDLARVMTQVNEDTVFINTAKRYPKYGPVSVEIRTRYLNGFNYNGNGTITGPAIKSGLLNLFITNNGSTTLGGTIGLQRLVVNGMGSVTLTGVRSPGLLLSMHGAPRVRLNGTINLARLNINGQGWLKMHWVKSDWLDVTLRGKTHVELAGVANKLNLRVFDQAHFNGRYFRVKRVFAKTCGQSVALISSVDRQHSLASDASDIYFYNLPEMKTDYMAQYGSVLDMRDWGTASMQEYTVLNKQLQ